MNSERVLTVQDHKEASISAVDHDMRMPVLGELNGRALRFDDTGNTESNERNGNRKDTRVGSMSSGMFKDMCDYVGMVNKTFECLFCSPPVVKHIFSENL